ncbi:hypothetical protein WMF18_09880 [Sorangium sp. So ce315]|uniref:hypothetical protein n=1 Tax=Sorangium sp. So ce315 TaxID=3133299 RepID=UPI003F60D1DE
MLGCEQRDAATRRFKIQEPAWRTSCGLFLCPGSEPGKGEVSRLYILLCGYEILEKTVSTRDRGGRFLLAEPVSAYLLETARGHVLIDAGLNSAIVHDPALREEHSTKQGIRPPVILPEHELAHQLAQIGMRPEDIRARGARLLLGHDPQLIQSVRLLPASCA